MREAQWIKRLVVASITVILGLIPSAMAEGDRSPYRPLTAPPITGDIPKPAIYMILDTSGSMRATGLDVGFDWFAPEVERMIEAAEAKGGDINYKQILEDAIDQYCAPATNRRNYEVVKKESEGVVTDESYNDYEVVLAQNSNGTYRYDRCVNLSRIDALRAIAPQMLRDYRGSALLGYGTLGYHSLHLAETNIHPSGEVILPVSDLTKISDEEFEQHIKVMENFKPNTVTPILSAVYEATKQFRGAAIVEKRGGGTASTYRIPTGMSYRVAESPIKYRCQENHLILFTDGDPNSTGAMNIIYEDHEKYGLEALYTSELHRAEGFDHYISPPRYAGLNRLSQDIARVLQNIDLRDAKKPIKYDEQNPEHQKSLYMKDPYGMLAYRSSGERVNRELDETGRGWHSFGSRPMPIYTHVLRLGFPETTTLNYYINNLLTPDGGVYISANTAEDFLGGFDTIFKNIVTSTSGASAAESQFSFSQGSVRYSTSYDNFAWTGEIRAERYQSAEESDTEEGKGWHKELWNTNEKVIAGQGTIYTLYNNNHATFSLTTARRVNPEANARQVAWIRGYHRTHPIGDIIDSNLVYYGLDRSYINLYALGNDLEESFMDYVKYRANRVGLSYRDLIITGANDGLIHMIYANNNDPAIRRSSTPERVYDDYYTGRRYGAIFPSFLAERLESIVDKAQGHTFTMNGQTNIFDMETSRHNNLYRNFSTIGISAMGSGGKGLVGYRLFNAYYNSNGRYFVTPQPAMRVIWEIENESDEPTLGFEHLGYTYSDIEFIQEGRINSAGLYEGRPVGIFGNGYHVNDHGIGRGSYLYLIDLETGRKLHEIMLDPFGKGASTPALVVSKAENGYQQVNRLYVGTYDGHLYRLDFEGLDSVIDYNDEPTLIFNTHGRPISARPAIERFGMNEYWVMFGTGSIINEIDRQNNREQDYFISFKDDGTLKTVNHLKHIVLDHRLLKKDYLDNVDLEAYGTESSGLYEVTPRVINGSNGHNGWVVFLNSGALKGERVVRMPSTVAGKLVVFTTWGIELAPDPEDICIGDRSFGKTLMVNIKSGLGEYMRIGEEKKLSSGFGLVGHAPGTTTGEGLVQHRYTGGGVGIGLYERVRDHLYGKSEDNSIYDYTSYESAKDRDGRLTYSTDTDEGSTILIEPDRDKVWSEETNSNLAPRRIYQVNH